MLLVSVLAAMSSVASCGVADVGVVEVVEGDVDESDAACSSSFLELGLGQE